MAYVKLYRSLLDSNIFAHPIALKIWIWCLLKANYRSQFIPVRSGRGEVIKELLPGQFIFGRFKAEEQLNINGSTIYKWLQKMQDFNMLKIESNTLHSIISIVNWEEYQQESNTAVTQQEQPSNNPVTMQGQPSNTDKNVLEVKEDKESKEQIQTNALLEKIKIFFGLTEELHHINKWHRIQAFLNQLEKENKTPYFETQFSNYQKYKKESNEKIHGFESFIEGGWDAENWAHKLIREIPKL